MEAASLGNSFTYFIAPGSMRWCPIYVSSP